MIEFRDIHKSFGTKTVLEGVSLDVAKGDIRYIIGLSGAGKSVLVKHLVGLIRPDSGRVFLEDRDITDLKEREFYPIRKRCAMVFQHSTLFDSMTIVDNVALPIRKHLKLSHEEAKQSAQKRLDDVQMGHAANRFPSEIGAGLQKRVAIARALTLDPDFVIFDEPTTGLDPSAAEHVDKLIRSLSDNLGVTSIVVSHDPRSIFSVADAIAMLYEGKIRFDGTRDELVASIDPVVQQFIRGLSEGPIQI
jgi:phospholipid/cholesterol/gamma-HCH transport system ATP-binding protein